MPNRVLLAARLGFMRSEARDNQRGTVVVSVSEAANSVLVPNLWSSAGELLVAGAVVNSSALFRRSTLVATALVLALARCRFGASLPSTADGVAVSAVSNRTRGGHSRRSRLVSRRPQARGAGSGRRAASGRYARRCLDP
jgi:hypothetical protein